MGKNLIIIIIIALFVGIVASSTTVIYALKGSSKAGVSSTEKLHFDARGYINSIKEFITSLSPIVNESSTTIENSDNTSTTTSTSEVDIKMNNNVVTPPKHIPPKTYCINYIIDSGEFESSKCYQTDDYNKLLDYLMKYANAKAMVKAEDGSIDFTCDGWSDIFKEACEESKESKKKYEAEVEKYRSLILNLVR